MNIYKKYQILLTLIIYLLLFKYTIINYFNSDFKLPHISSINSDAESIYTLQKQLSFKKATIRDLEMIPSISSKRAKLIYKKRLEIYELSAKYENGEKYKAYTLVSGIGEKTAKKLSIYLDLN